MIGSDVIVVGSGATGSMAAQTIIESGGSVLMLDAGRTDPHYAGLLPEQNYLAIRRSDPEQYRYLLGERFESVLASSSSTGAQLTPPRRHVVAEVDRFLPISSPNFFPMESLALGGLGSAWGLGCCVFSEAELSAAGLPAAAMKAAYEIVAARIGISGERDDAQPYTFSYLDGIQPTIPLDPTAALVYRNYAHHRNRMHADGFYMGRPALALLTEPLGGRNATQLRDMDFYSDAERAAWRPWITIETLRQHARFQYANDRFVTRFEERDGGVSVVTLGMSDLQERTYRCRRLILASGTLGTARIVLRSEGRPGASLPLLCNPFAYIPCLVPGRIGRSMPERNTGLAQLELFHDADGRNDDVAMASIYSYRSLMLFRLLRETPIDLQDARPLMRALMSGLLIMAVQYPESRSPGKYLQLEPDAGTPTGDRLRVNYELSGDEAARVAQREKLYLRAMRRLGAWPLRRVYPGHGSSIHYAGTLPFSDVEKPHALSPDGRVWGTNNVFVADGSGFAYLPAKGLTLSLMANAHRVAAGVLQTAAP